MKFFQLTPVSLLRRRAFPMVKPNAPSKTAPPLTATDGKAASATDAVPKLAGLAQIPLLAKVKGKVADEKSTNRHAKAATRNSFGFILQNIEKCCNTF